ncbi:MAG: DUF4124 domain-containing protein [Rhodocyclaceae bacterium]|nr:DUF4124 domain-containing protein [Rhodocyclaceae bacterium]
MNPNWKAASFASLLLAWLPAQADVWKCVDPDGKVAYTNTRPSTKGCKLLSQDQPVNTVKGNRASSAATPTPGNFPRVDGNMQKERDMSRRQILEKELAQEQDQLNKAQKELAEQESLRNGDERNYQKVVERLKPYQDSVAEHQRNVDAIRQEIGKLR